MTFNEEITLDHLYNVQDGRKLLNELKKFFGHDIMAEHTSDPINDTDVLRSLGKDIVALGGSVHEELSLLIASVIEKHKKSFKDERENNDAYRMLTAVMFEILVHHMMASVITDLYKNTDWIMEDNMRVTEARKQAVFIGMQQRLLESISRNIAHLGERTSTQFLHTWGTNVAKNL